MRAEDLGREQLYELVWRDPVSVVAHRFSLSDNGLRKLCIRRGVPVPARGYWAEKAAGKAPPVPPLEKAPPKSEVSQTPAKRRRKQIEPVAEVRPLPPDLKRCQRMVSATAAFYECMQRPRPSSPDYVPGLSRYDLPPKVNGRWAPDEAGCLRIVATERNIDWILRFHVALLGSLSDAGCKVIAGSVGPKSPCAFIAIKGEQAPLAFYEEFEKVSKSPQDLWPTFRPVDRFRLVFDAIAKREWRGTAPELEEALPTIVAQCVDVLIKSGPLRAKKAEERRAQRLVDTAAEERRRKMFAEQQELYRCKVEREAQVPRAMEVARAYRDYRLLNVLLNRVSALAGEDAAVMAWLSIVRDQLVDPTAQLVGALQRERDTWEHRPDGDMR